MTLVLECSDLKTKLRKVDAGLTEAVMELAREAFEKGYDVSIVRDVYGLLVPLEDPESEELRVELNKSFASFFQGINPARKHYVWHIPCVSIYVGREGPDGIEPEYWFHVMEYGDGEDALAKAIRSRPNLGANGVDIADVLVAELEAWKKLSEEAKWADEIARKIKKQEEKLTNLIGMALSPFREDAKVVWINGVPILVGETIRHYHVVCPLEKSKLDLKLVKAYWRRLLPYVDRDIRDEFRAVGELCASFRFLDELADKPLVAQRPRCCCFDNVWRLRPVAVSYTHLTLPTN